MRFSWDETKRRSNLKAHGLDFTEVESIFEGTTATIEDDRFAYGEQRFRTIGWLAGCVVSVIHTESETEIRVISFRKATRHEEAFFFAHLQD